MISTADGFGRVLKLGKHIDGKRFLGGFREMGTAGLALSVLITALLAAVVANHASAVAAPSP